MRMIGIASELWMPEGAFVLAALPASDIRRADRRVNRAKTLDGGVVVTDGGYADGDRDMAFQVPSTQPLWESLWAFFQSAAYVTVSVADGCYLAALKRIREESGVINIEVMIKSRLSA